jgi:hypothetical protein
LPAVLRARQSTTSACPERRVVSNDDRSYIRMRSEFVATARCVSEDEVVLVEGEGLVVMYRVSITSSLKPTICLDGSRVGKEW